MSWHIFQSCCLMAALGLGVPGVCQTSQPLEQERGFTEIESIQGTINSSAKLLKLDSVGGYDFNKHFGMFAGIPVYFANVSTTSTTTSTTGTSTSTSTNNSGIGNVYVGFVLRVPHEQWNFASTLTGAAPTGSTTNGYSSGRVNVDWSNHVDRTFNRLTPFLDAGLANSVPDSPLLTRPFTSLGVVGHLEEGAELELVHHLSAGASAYQILPTGNQKIYSRVVTSGGPKSGAGASGSSGPGKGAAASASHHRPFETAFVTTGTGLTQENGFNTWFALQPNQFWRAEVGYSRSMTFDFNSFTFNLGVDVGKLVRSRKGH
jgi:hypothetical protein